MNIKNIILGLFIVFVVLFSVSGATAYEEPISERDIQELAKESQQENAELDIQLETDEIIYKLKKDKQLDIADAMFGLIKGIFLIVFDLIKLGVLLFLMHYIIYFFGVVLPTIFSKIVGSFTEFTKTKGDR